MRGKGWWGTGGPGARESSTSTAATTAKAGRRAHHIGARPFRRPTVPRGHGDMVIERKYIVRGFWAPTNRGRSQEESGRARMG